MSPRSRFARRRHPRLSIGDAHATHIFPWATRCYPAFMPNRGSAFTSGSPETPDCSDRVTPEAPDEPDQLKRGFFERLFDRVVPPTALVRFLGYVRPHLWLVTGGSVMGILKFTLPLAVPP